MSDTTLAITWIIATHDEDLRDEIADTMFEAVMDVQTEEDHPLSGRDINMFSLLGLGPDDYERALRQGIAVTFQWSER